MNEFRLMSALHGALATAVVFIILKALLRMNPAFEKFANDF